MVFNNQSFSATVPEWQVDAYATRKTLQELQRNPRFATAALDLGGATYEQMRANGGAMVWEAAAKQGFDRVLILAPSVSSNYGFVRPGYGLFERSVFGSGNRCVYAGFTMNVFDVASKDSLAWEWGGGQPCEFSKDNDLVFRPAWTQYSQAEQQTIRERLLKRLDFAIRYSAEKLRLVPAQGG